jgi:hypothetical protein
MIYFKEFFSIDLISKISRNSQRKNWRVLIPIWCEQTIKTGYIQANHL